MHKAMAVLYRPVKYKKGDLYLIEDYEGTDKYSNIMLDSPVNAAIGATVFFYNLGKELSKVMIHSLEKYLEQESESLLVSELNGDGINQSMRLLTEMSKNLKKLQSSPYFSV